MLRQLIICTALLGSFFLSRAIAAEHPDELYRQGYFEEAEEAYALLDMDHPDDVRYRYNRGCAAFQGLEYQTARAAFSSVLRKAEDNEMRFRTAYNLGNTAFMRDDFSAAMAYYKQAIFCNPLSEDAKYNLELTLKELQKLNEKKTDEKKKTRPELGDDTRGGKGSGGRGGEEHTPEEGTDEDLTGELEQVESGEEEMSEDSSDKPTAVMNKKTAEDFLDKIREDRSHFMHFQVPKDKKRGVKSGKDW